MLRVHGDSRAAGVRHSLMHRSEHLKPLRSSRWLNRALCWTLAVCVLLLDLSSDVGAHVRLGKSPLKWSDGSAATAAQPQVETEAGNSRDESAEEYSEDAFGGEDEELDPEIINEIAVEHLQAGNALAHEGRHEEAIEEWRIAAEFRPDSNVPWNNMANSFQALGNLSAARDAAEESCKRGVDHMSSTTLANTYKALKMYEEAEQILLKGVQHTMQNNRRYEHAFWTLAMLYHMQGDYIGSSLPTVLRTRCALFDANMGLPI